MRHDSVQRVGTVALVGPIPPPYGGISVHVARLRDGLEGRGWEVDSLATGWLAPTHGERCTYIGNSILRHIIGLLRSPATIVHVHHDLSVLAAVAVSAARLRGAKVVVTVHAPPTSLFRRRKRVDFFWRLALRGADRVIAVNRNVVDAIASVQREPPTVLPAFLPPTATEIDALDDAQRAWLAGIGDRPVVSTAIYRALARIGGRTDVYGLDQTVAAVSELAARGHDLALAVLLALPPESGEEEEYFASMVQQLEASLGARCGVFIGAKAPPIIARSRVFLRPTLSDGDSVAVREALALGVTVVASDAVPRPSGVILHACADAADLARGIERALTEPPRAPDRVTSTELDQVESVYRACLTRERRTGP